MNTEQMRVEIKKEIVEALVTSQSTRGAFYQVRKNGLFWFCTCPDHVMRDRITELAHECKHILAVKNHLNLTPLRT